MLQEYPEINDASAIALFWYYRNQLFFDQNLDRDPKCMLVQYEPLVQSPDRFGSALARFCGIAPNPALWRDIFCSSLRRQPPPDLDPEIRTLVNEMHDRLVKIWNDRNNIET